jgi:DNA-binding beta-propeller fold protein YncE
MGVLPGGSGSAAWTLRRSIRLRQFLWIPGLTSLLLGTTATPSEATPPAKVSQIPLKQEASALAVTPTGTVAYTVDGTTNQLQLLNLASHKVTHISIGDQLSDVAISPGGRELWVTSNCSDTGCNHTVYVLSTVSDQVISTLSIGGSTDSVAFSPDGQLAFVGQLTGSTASGETLDVIDLATDQVVHRIPVPIDIVEMAVSADSGTLYLATNSSGGPSGQSPSTLDVINIQAAHVVETIKQGSVIPCGLAVNPEDSVLYESFCGAASNYGLNHLSIHVFPVRQGVLERSYSNIAGSARGLAVSHDGRYLYAALTSSTGVAVISTRTGKEVSRIRLALPGDSTAGLLALSPDGHDLYCTSADLLSPGVLATFRIVS